MRLKVKIILSILVIVVGIILLPLWVAYNAEAQDAMGILLILIFLVNSTISLGLGILAGTDLKKLWWIPLLIALVFVISYWISLRDIVIEFFIYAGIYLVIGVISMFITDLLKKKIKKN